jgi:hypothetical protein
MVTRDVLGYLFTMLYFYRKQPQAFLEAERGRVSQLRLHDHDTKTLTADLNSAPCLQAYWWAEAQPYRSLRCPICRRLIANLQLAELDVKSCHYSLSHSKWSSRWNAGLPYIGPRHHALCAVCLRHVSQSSLCFFFRRECTETENEVRESTSSRSYQQAVTFTVVPLSSVRFSFVLPSYVECTVSGANLAKTGNRSKYEMLWSILWIVTFHCAVL